MQKKYMHVCIHAPEDMDKQIYNNPKLEITQMLVELTQIG